MNLTAQTTGVSVFEIAKMAKVEEEVNTKLWIEDFEWFSEKYSKKLKLGDERELIMYYMKDMSGLSEVFSEMQNLRNEFQQMGDERAKRVCDSFLAWAKEGERIGLWVL